MSDFEDDENFGLTETAEGKPSGGNAAALEEDDDDDIYGDIAGPNAVVYPLVMAKPSPQPETGITQEGALLDSSSLAVVERQKSGALAETSAPTDISNAVVVKKPLPKKLADTTVVYVGELEWWTTDADIETIASEFGPIESVTFFEEKGSGKSKGYCLIKFSSKEAANLCRHEMNGKCVVTFSYNSHAATKNSRQQTTSTAQAASSQAYAGREQQYNSRGTWGSHQGAMMERGMPLPPMPPWPNMGMTGLPMPGMGMPFMDAMSHPPDRDFKRRRY